MCDKRVWIIRQIQFRSATTMLKCYLCLILCLQFALINAARTRRGSSSSSGGVISAGSNAHEHIHIKVHIPDISHSRPRAGAHRLNRNNQNQQNTLSQRTPTANKKVLPTRPTHSENSKELPYEFDFFGIGDEDNSLPGTDVLRSSKYSPVVYTSNIQSGSSQQPMSQQFMRQLFAPEIMSALRTAESEENGVSHPYGLMEEPNALDTNDMMQEYFQRINQPKPQRSTIATSTNNLSNWSSKTTHKRKKYGSTGIGESYPKESLQQQFYNTILKQHSKPPTTSSTNRKSAQQRYQRQQQQKHQQQQYSAPLHQNLKAFQQDFEEDGSSSSAFSDEIEAAEDSSAAVSTSASMEDMTTAFNGLKPISYHDMYGEYATPITTATTSTSTSTAALASNHHNEQQQDLSLQQETIPSYTSTITAPYTANDWLQHYQRPEKKQQQTFYKPHHQQQQQQQQQQQHHQQQIRKNHKPKSQQTQFVLQPTTLRLASSPLSLSLSSPSSSQSSSSSSSLSTSPISSGFGSSSNSIGSSSSTWSIPYEYDFVQQSHQQQLAAQQQPQQQQQHQHQLHQHQQDYKLTSSYKKRKNRTKRKRNRIIVE